MAERRRFPVLPVALGGCLVLLFVVFGGGSGGGSAPPSGRLLQSLAAEAQVRPQRQAARPSLVAGGKAAARLHVLLQHSTGLSMNKVHRAAVVQLTCLTASAPAAALLHCPGTAGRHCPSALSRGLAIHSISDSMHS